MDDPVEVALVVAAALEACGVPYSVGGSLASSFSGEPRASIDADIVVALKPHQIEAFVAALGTSFYADAGTLQRAAAAGRTANIIHKPSSVKVDLFFAHTPLEERQLERRRLVRIAVDPDRFLYVHSPEDILLQKLLWYRDGGGVSDRQWRDVLAIARTQGPRLDRQYLIGTAASVGLSSLLERALSDAEG